MEISPGSVVKSTAGHDSGRYFVVIRCEKSFVYISDGKERKLETPKKKNIKHIAKTDSVVELLELTNKKLRKLLNAFCVSLNKIE